MYLVDSDICIDYLRLYPPALKFFHALGKKERHIAMISQFELFQGCTKQEHQMKIEKFIKHFKTVSSGPKVSRVALEIFRKNRLKTGIGIPDSFVAASALAENLTLVTRNSKHYKDIDRLKVEVPYR